MDILDRVTGAFVGRSRAILGDNLTGIYLHGSAVMGCFNAIKSDIDLIAVVDGPLPGAVKRAYMDMVVALNADAPQKGIEMSVVRREVCKPFVYPTPFELHFSVAHLEWYRADPEDYVRRMNGVDPDLAAHFTVLRARGARLCGADIEDVFGPVDRGYYVDSILRDVEGAEADIAANPTYVALNLCRVAAYLEEGLVLSKREGGEWGLEHVPPRYRGVIEKALDDYASTRLGPWEDPLAREYAAYMLNRVREWKK